MAKVAEVNLEAGLPTVEAALRKLKDALVTYKRTGCRAVVVVHGYGSSGVGGKIKPAVTACLGDSSMSGLVKAQAGGEQWHYRKRELLAACKELEAWERRISNNEGVTVVILK